MEFLSYKIEVRNQMKQNDVTLRITNSKGKILFLHFRVSDSKLKNKKFYFSMGKLLLYHFRVANLTLKN